MSPLSATPAGRLLRPSLVGQNRKGDHDGRHLKEGRADHQKPDFMLRLRVHGVITPKALDRSALSPRPRRNKNPRNTAPSRRLISGAGRDEGMVPLIALTRRVVGPARPSCHKAWVC